MPSSRPQSAPANQPSLSAKPAPSPKPRPKPNSFRAALNRLRRLDRTTRLKLIIFGTLILGLVLYLVLDIIFNGPLTRFLSNRDQVVLAVQSFGFFAPLIYVILQIVQTVAAPIPGQVVGSVGGFLFGPWGILWTLIGSLIGDYIVFRLARRFGRPLLEKLFSAATIKKFDFIIDSKSAPLILFAIFLLPGFPDDVVCYIAGLTKLPIRQLMLLVGLGRLPTIVLVNYLGAGLSSNLGLVVAISVLMVFFLGLIAWKREAIIKFFKRRDQSKPAQPTNSKAPTSDRASAPKSRPQPKP